MYYWNMIDVWLEYCDSENLFEAIDWRYSILLQSLNQSQSSKLVIQLDNMVGGFNPSEKYLSVGIILPIYGGKLMFQTTNQQLIEPRILTVSHW